jgi:tRNA pseudouridine55 synthase
VGKTMEGVLLINKPVGPSSFDVVRTVRRLSGMKKIGHAGTLDPLASGLMVVALGRYTKLAGILTGANKTYKAVFRMGITTSTDDSEGEVLETKCVAHLQRQDIEDALKQFVGPIKQIPPQFSAIKINGKRAYALARAKQKVVLEARDVHIFAAKIEDCSLPEVSLHIDCSKGTYVRSLARDMGEQLQVGAIAQSIHRVRSGALMMEKAISLDDLTKENIAVHLLTNKEAIAGLETIDITPEDKCHLICGRKLSVMPKIVNDVAVALCEGDLVAILAKHEGRTVLSRVL